MKRIDILASIVILLALFNVGAFGEKFTINKGEVLQAQSDNWPMAGANPQRTSWTPNETASGPLKALWVKRMEPYVPLHAQIIGANGKVYVSTAAGLYAFDANTGAQKWVYSTEMPLGHSPTYDNGILYVGGLDRKIHAVQDNGNSFSLLWTYTADGPFETNPLVVDNKVIAGNRDGFLYALNTSNGGLAWKFDTQDGTAPRAQIRYSAAYLNGKAFFGAMNGYAYGVNVSNGTLSWKTKLPGLGWMSWWPVIYDNKVIFTRTEETRNTSSDFTGGISFDNERDQVIGTGSSGLPVGPLGTVSGNWTAGTITTDVSTNVRGLTTIPNWFEQNPHARNVFVLNQSDGVENTFDTDNDGTTDAAPILRGVQDFQTAYPPILSGQDNVLYFRSPLEDSTTFPGSMAAGWKYGTSILSLPVSSMAGQSPDWPLDEYTGLSGGGRYIYWHLCCDRFLGSADVSQSNTNFPSNTNTRQWRHVSGSNRTICSFDSNLPAGYHQARDKYLWLIADEATNCDPAIWEKANENYDFYMGHTGNVGPTIYNGKMYAMLSNALVAFDATGQGANAPVSDVASPANINTSTEPISFSTLNERLEDQISKIINNKDGNGQTYHLKPGYGITGNFDLRSKNEVGDELLDYWHYPGDVHYTLLRALPHLSSESLKNSVRSYLKSEFDGWSPAQYAHIGWRDGVFRESFDWPPTINTNISNNTPKTGISGWTGWSLPPHNIYAVWKYAVEDAASNFDTTRNANDLFLLVKTKLSSPVTANNANVTDSYLASFPDVHNAYIAGYMGYVELAKLANRPASDYSSHETELNRLLALRVSQYTSSPTAWSGLSYFAAKFFYTLGHAWNFMYMTPELGDYLNQNALSQVQNTFNPDIVQQGYVSQIPYWPLAHNREVQGEGGVSPYQQTHSVFQAKALILKQSREELSKYLDSPLVPVGDLYYIDNLVSTIEAGGGGDPTSPPTPTPTPGIPGDINGDGIVNILDYTLLSNNFGTTNPDADINDDGIVNILDYTILSNNFGQSPTPTPGGNPTGLSAGTGHAVWVNTTGNPDALPDATTITAMINEVVSEARTAYGSGVPKTVLLINNVGSNPEFITAIQNEFGVGVPIGGAGTANKTYNSFTAQDFTQKTDRRSMAVVALGGSSISDIFMSQQATSGNYTQAGINLATALQSEIDPTQKNLIHMFGPGHNPDMTSVLNGMKQVLGDPVPSHIKIIGSAAYITGSSVANGILTSGTIAGVLIKGNFQVALRGVNQTPLSDLERNETSEQLTQEVVNELGGLPDITFYVPGHPGDGLYEDLRQRITGILGTNSDIFGHEGGGEYGHLTTNGQPFALPVHFFIAGLKAQ